MGTQVEASTIRAGQLFSTANFRIPDFQRDYSWSTEGEVSDFWNDLVKGMDTPPYFLGLLIITDEDDAKTVVDGQQRIITLSLLANSLRQSAQLRSKSLVADSMRDVFLYAINYKENSRSPRVNSASQRDRRTLQALLERQQPSELNDGLNTRLLDAQKFLDDKLEADLFEEDASARLGKWAHFLSNGITFALFEHPDRNAAYKVYEVVNMRGKDLTPAELIKSYVIGSADSDKQGSAYQRWTDLEDPFVDLSADTQFTSFIRHTVTLRHGYVEPRDLYQAITEHYPGSYGVELLLEELEAEAALYLQMVNPPADGEDDVTKSLMILDALGLRTVRPIFASIMYSSNAEEGLRQLLKIIVPRLASGTFGTGSVERRFAEAAQLVFQTKEWMTAIGSLRNLVPSREDFRERVETRSFSKGILLVLRSATLQGSVLPSLEGYIHHIRPRNAENWLEFDDDDFKTLGSTLGNVVISKLERRPRGSNTLEGVKQRLLSTLVDFESTPADIASLWSADTVREENQRLASELAELWYE